MLAATASNVAAAGTASATAAGKVALLAKQLRGLAAIGIVTVGVEYVISYVNARNKVNNEIGELDKTLSAGWNWRIDCIWWSGTNERSS